MIYRVIFFMVAAVFMNSCSTKFSEKEQQEYIQKGKEIAQSTFKELSSNLMMQMKEGGPSQAIPYCNLEASPLTNKLSDKYNVVIKRTSSKLRSCDNEPTERELEIMEQYEQLLSDKKDLKPIVEIDSENKKHFYAPIKIQANCLMCHGEVSETMTIQTDSIVKSLYPFDLAVGYKEGELRGIWSIAFNN